MKNKNKIIIGVGVLAVVVVGGIFIFGSKSSLYKGSLPGGGFSSGSGVSGPVVTAALTANNPAAGNFPSTFNYIKILEFSLTPNQSNVVLRRIKFSKEGTLNTGNIFLSTPEWQGLAEGPLGGGGSGISSLTTLPSGAGSQFWMNVPDVTLTQNTPKTVSIWLSLPDDTTGLVNKTVRLNLKGIDATPANTSLSGALNVLGNQFTVVQ